MFGRKKKKCQHNINKPNTTVKLLDNFKTMVVPDMKYGVCVCCGKKFKIKNKRKLKGKEELNDANVGGNESEA